ncbi:DUF2169 family type VI secretion system accessory protein [Paraburkholderia bannensis]|uniref:DUF2169 family type VI secretion system accessory protein n=1 Tax=Paraburkholderia bannensis TaxID=765414 RepID=UPI002AB7B35A|nr:DUF2169 domain-containing protein [Paraburkholderia bannensis]
MEIVIGSRHHAVDIASALDTSGREHLVIVAKATWQIPGEGQRPRPLDPVELAYSDVYVGAPGESAMLYGSDFARFKPRCDVVFDASAHAPDAQPVQTLGVAWQVGALRKALMVHGPRVWRKRLGFTVPGKPEPFVAMPLHFGHAFGGTSTWNKGDAVLTEALLENPAGLGWRGPNAPGEVHGTSVPNLEAPDARVERPNGRYRPVAFSALARHWAPRKDFAGTYDEAWQEQVFPLLPADFDEQYHQCAPADQQMPWPAGGDDVVLRNMMAGRPEVRFKLPRFDGVHVQVVDADYEVALLRPVVDTLYFEPDQGRFSAVWRTSVPLQRNIHDIRGIELGVGRPGRLDALMDRINNCAGCGTDMAAALPGGKP